ncbi:hypothetical protein ACIF80_03865 [Streptomyces sp. NPDC085927]|uniref:hypothetical protein n=1 Tax=Streptomyces sp. NPDC085927 TaxID=3365738 RepID=UPI0037D04E02
MTVDYRAEARADRATQAEQRRLDAAAAERRREDRQRAEDERAARLTAQQTADKARRRAERAAWRGQALTPQNVYRVGTLALVVASGLASLPAQVLHFVAISPMLLPLPLSLEGAAWVMAAGVAFADSRHLAARVRWLLRLFVVAAAGFAASVNYGYGVHLSGLSPAEQSTAGIGLAAVTLLGPVLFEIRQWVCTLAASEDDSPEARSARRHSRLRRRHHRSVARTADRLLSAAPLGTLTAEEAWARAWAIETGADCPGMTPRLHRRAVQSAADLEAALTPQPKTGRKHKKSTRNGRERSTPDLRKSADRAGPAVDLAPVVVNLPEARPVGFLKSALPLKPSADPQPVRPVTLAAQSARPARRATGRVPQSARPARRPARTPDELLTEARQATAGWPVEHLTADRIRKAVHTSSERARTLRDALTAERTGAGVTS